MTTCKPKPTIYYTKKDLCDLTKLMKFSYEYVYQECWQSQMLVKTSKVNVWQYKLKTKASKPKLHILIDQKEPSKANNTNKILIQSYLPRILAEVKLWPKYRS